MAVKIGDGYLEIEGRPNKSKLRATAEKVGKQSGKSFGKEFDKEIDKESNKTFKKMLTRALGIGKKIGAIFAKGVMPLAMLTKFGLLAGLGATAIAGLAAGVAKAIPAVVGLGNALVVASGTLVALPGVIATLVGAMITLKVGLSGVGEAFQALASGDVDKFNEALKKLSPNAQAFVKELKKLWPELEKVKQGVQDMLFANLDKQLQSLAKYTIPAVGTGMKMLAASINLLLNKALDKLSSKQTADTIGSSFDNMAQAFAALDRAIGPVVGALVSVVNVGSQVLKELAGPIAATLDDWGNRIQVMANQGTLKAMFYEGLDAAKALFGLLKDIFGIIGGLVKAAGASDGLFGFFTRLHEAIDSVQGQNALTSFFESMKTISDALAPALPALGDALALVARGVADIALAFAPYLPPLVTALGTALATLEPAITALAPLLGIIALGLQPLAVILRNLVVAAAPGLEAALGGIVGALTALEPVAAPVGKALGDMLTAVAPLLPTLATLAAVLLRIAATALTDLATALMPVISVLAGAFTNALQILLPPLAQMAAAVLPLFAQAGLQVAQAFIPLAPVLAQLVTEGIAAMVPYIPQIVAGFTALLPVIAQLAAQFGQALLQALLNLVPVLPGLVKSGMELVLALLALFQALLPLMPQLIPLVTILLEAALNANTVQLVVGILTAALIVITGVVMTTTAIIEGLVWIFKAAWNAGKSLAGAIGGYIADSFNKLKNFGSDAIHALGNLSGTLREAGKSLIRGLISGIESMIGAVKSKLSSITHLLPSWKGPMDVDLKLLQPSGEALMTGLSRGISAGADDVFKQLRGITSDIGSVGNVTVTGTGVGTRNGGQAVTMSIGNVTVNVTATGGEDGRKLGADIADSMLDKLTGAVTRSLDPRAVAGLVDEGRRQRSAVFSQRSKL